tara:strand:- start:3366 stop:4154 length:789 start_codon:yes stop_codon:yes gene_type:complete
VQINLNQENRSRILVACIAAPIIAIFFLKKDLLIIGTIAICMIAEFEISLHYCSKIKATLNSIIGTAIALIGIVFFPASLFLFINTLFLAALFFFLFKKEKSANITNISQFYSGIVCWNLLFCAIQIPGIKYFMLITLIAFTTDTFAFLIGKQFGRNHLSKKYSKNKTIEGAVGGWIAGMLIFIILTDIINISLSSNIFWLLLLSLPIVCQIGDLFSSMIKRKIDIKDFSNFLLSHGGFLDRLDSIIAGVFYINILFILELL